MISYLLSGTLVLTEQQEQDPEQDQDQPLMNENSLYKSKESIIC